MIETYWNEMFGEFKTGPRSFLIPALPEPLMSPHFGVQNIIGPSHKPPKMSFTLCYFNPVDRLTSKVEVETLSQAIKRKEFWNYQEEHHSSCVHFSQKLFPFLIEHQKDHLHLFTLDNKGMRTSVLIGRGETTAFLFNASVRTDLRNLRLGREMLNDSRNYIGSKQSFYWTRYPWLTLGADLTEDYHLIF